MDDRAQELINKQAPVIEPGYTFGTVTDKISSIVLTRPTSNGWFVGFGIAFLITMGLLYSVGYLFVRGVGIWGVNIPVGWGFAIVNFVWWIGIGHAGTLISAILLLLRQSWRNSINRFAEAMTLFAVACAGMFPVLHLGRPWLACWPWDGAAPRGIGLATKWLISCSPAWRRRSCSRFIRSSASILLSASCRDGTRRSFRPTSSQAQSIPASRWC